MKSTKSDGVVSVYGAEKGAKSSLKANADTEGEEISPAMAKGLADEVFVRLTGEYEIITTADVRACVYALLLEKKLPGTAKSYMEFDRK